MGKNYPRRVKAMCSRCYPYRDDCLDHSCPFYDIRKYNNKDEVIAWWDLPANQWEEGSMVALTEKRLIERKDTMTEEQKAAAAERMNRYWEGKRGADV